MTSLFPEAELPFNLSGEVLPSPEQPEPVRELPESHPDLFEQNDPRRGQIPNGENQTTTIQP